MTPASAGSIPPTPLLDYFRSTFPEPRGKNWGARRLAEVRGLIDEPGRLSSLFEESVAIVEHEYRNYQPFYPGSHAFGSWADTKIPHGDQLRGTVDVAARLSTQKIWSVRDDAKLDFRYVDREISITRAKPAPDHDPGAVLRIDLFLANARDRTPILGEVKLRSDQCAFYAFVQVLTQAAYAVTPSQRERLVLFGSRPEFVLREAVPEEPARVDLYVLLIEPPRRNPHDVLQEAAIKLSRKVANDQRVASRIRRIAWIEGADMPDRGLALTSVAAGGR
jgi:hypothetical protein